MIAKKLDTKVTDVNNGILWELDEPVVVDDGFKDINTKYVVTSYINNMWACETLAFPADENGNVIDWGEVGGKWYAVASHTDVIRSMGYTVES